MFTTFLDLIKTRPFSEIITPIPDDIQQTSFDFVKRFQKVEEMITKCVEDWTNEYARMTAMQSGIPVAPPPPPITNNTLKHPDRKDAIGKSGIGSDIPMIASHPHLFPCMISSLGSGCNMSKVLCHSVDCSIH